MIMYILLLWNTNAFTFPFTPCPRGAQNNHGNVPKDAFWTHVLVLLGRSPWRAQSCHEKAPKDSFWTHFLARLGETPGGAHIQRFATKCHAKPCITQWLDSTNHKGDRGPPTKKSHANCVSLPYYMLAPWHAGKREEGNGREGRETRSVKAGKRGRGDKGW